MRKYKNKSKEELIQELKRLNLQIKESSNNTINFEVNEALFKGIFAYAPIGIELYNSSGELISINQTCLDIFGVKSMKEVQGFKLFDDPNISDDLKNILLNGESIDFEKQFDFELVKELKLYNTSRSGICDLHIQITPFQNSGENEKGFVVHVQDITQRKCNENKSYRYSRIFEDSLNEIFLFNSETLKFTQANQAALQNLGYTFEELSKMTPVDIKPQITNKEFEKLIKPLNRKEKEKIVFKTVHQRKDKSLYDVEVHLQLLYFENESLFSAIIIDITNKIKGENKVKESEQKFRNIMEQSPIATLILSPDGHIIDLNSAFVKLWGVNLESLTELDGVYDFMKDEQIIKMGLMPEIKKAFLGKNVTLPPVEYDAPKTMDSIGYGKFGGNKRWIQVRLYPLKDEKGKLINVILTEEDVTRQKKAEEEIIKYRNNLEELVKERTKEVDLKALKIEESQKAMRYLLEDVNDARKELSKINKKLSDSNKDLESFAYSVSHDLKSPIRAINGYTNVLLEDFPELFIGEKKEYLDLIIKNSQKMNTLIDDLLRFSRIGRNELDKSEFNLSIMVKDVLNSVKENYSNIKIRSIIQEDVLIRADLATIKQVLVNLIGNAVKFSSKNKLIEIKFGEQKSDDKTIYYIKDNGIGFDTKYTDKLFEVFQRLHSSEKFEGTGVGLAIVKRIINKHGGDIWVESVIGKGSTFYFTVL